MLPIEPTFSLQSKGAVPEYDLVCLSHLRWDFVYQRPQHLLSRCGQERRVFFVEEPLFDAEAAQSPYLHISQRAQNIRVVVPHFPTHTTEEETNALLIRMIDELFAIQCIDNYVLWYYTPMALSFTGHLEPLAIVYDCMDELSAFKDAPPILKQREADLFACADLVFTGGYSLYQAKRQQHRHVYAFPSSVDTAHFRQARHQREDPADQQDIPYPRLGFYGVIDERMNLDLLRAIAEAEPAWHLVIIGPVTKIDPATLPRGNNIHYLGQKSYSELPAYLAGWDVALLPFAHNDSTRFISPTKTLEYLAGGKPVVSTSIHDVVYPYGQQGLVMIADTHTDFITAIKRALDEHDVTHLQQVDTFLSQTSWDATWKNMKRLINEIVVVRQDWPAYSMISSSSFEPSSDYFVSGGID